MDHAFPAGEADERWRYPLGTPPERKTNGIGKKGASAMPIVLVVLLVLLVILLFGLTANILGVIVTLIIAGLVGWLADVIVPGRLPWGWLGAILAGLVGSWLGTALLGKVGPEIAGIAIIPALLGAIILAFVVELLFKGGRRREV
ncbi:MAG: GlsB/YeaQ/YmgE family stress response membrane protein [Sphingomonadaceae bacterium]